MKLTLVHPCVGRRAGDRRYLRSWQMEPLPCAMLAGLTPPEVDVRFFDDRLEQINYAEPTDVVAISVETYTARRSYQIASEYRARGVPVIMGGFHASLAPNEVQQYCDVVVLGEAEGVWEQILDDARRGRLESRYESNSRPDLNGRRPRHQIYDGKRYLPIRLVEAGRGCRFRCEFCAIQSVFKGSQMRRAVSDILADIDAERNGASLVFFVDDNFASDQDAARELLEALEGRGIRWVSQMSVDAARNEAFVAQLQRSGCVAVLIGFESLSPTTLRVMGKSFNALDGGYAPALANLRRHRIGVYGTFIFGYDGDQSEQLDASLEFALEHELFIAAFNHLTPFPGTPLYQRLERDRRLAFDAWWLDESYRYNDVPYKSQPLAPADVKNACQNARARFYSRRSIMKRLRNPANRADAHRLRTYLLANFIQRRDLHTRAGLPLGDEGCPQPLPHR